jgi:hypothetical protein
MTDAKSFTIDLTADDSYRKIARLPNDYEHYETTQTIECVIRVDDPSLFTDAMAWRMPRWPQRVQYAIDPAWRRFTRLRTDPEFGETLELETERVGLDKVVLRSILKTDWLFVPGYRLNTASGTAIDANHAIRIPRNPTDYPAKPGTPSRENHWITQTFACRYKKTLRVEQHTPAWGDPFWFIRLKQGFRDAVLYPLIHLGLCIRMSPVQDLWYRHKMDSDKHQQYRWYSVLRKLEFYNGPFEVYIDMERYKQSVNFMDCLCNTHFHEPSADKIRKHYRLDKLGVFLYAEDYVEHLARIRS